jgi:hypothetical protein
MESNACLVLFPPRLKGTQTRLRRESVFFIATRIPPQVFGMATGNDFVETLALILLF